MSTPAIYFIFKFNLLKNQMKILDHAGQLDGNNGAIEKIKKQATDYFMKKNKKLFDETGKSKSKLEIIDEEKYITDTKFLIKDSTNEVNTIDVYCQQRFKIKGWTGTSYKEKEQRVAFFSYAKYDLKDVTCSQCSTALCAEIRPTITANRIRPLVSVVNQELLRELKSNDFFASRKNYVDAQTSTTKTTLDEINIAIDGFDLE